jgi:hypothetical protein
MVVHCEENPTLTRDSRNHFVSRPLSGAQIEQDIVSSLWFPV